MRLEQLIYFLTVCEKGTISAACTKLNLTQQSLSANIRTLEEEIGTPLLTRNNRGIGLTPAGEKARICFEKILNEWQFFLQDIKTINIPANISGTISIGAMKHYGRVVLPQVTVYLLKHYPNIVFHTDERSFATISKGVQNGQYDIGFIYFFNTDNQTEYFADDLQFHKLFTCKPYLWVSTHSPLAKKDALDLTVLADYPIGLPDDIDQSFCKKIFSAVSVDNNHVQLYRNKRFLSQIINEGIRVCFDLQYGSYDLYLTNIFYRQNVKAIPLIMPPNQCIEAGYITRKNANNLLLDLFKQYFSESIYH